jgi:membrane associated rhomboid family serine protease
MSKPIRYYVQFGVAMFVANLIISVMDGSELDVKILAKAVLAGLIAAALLAWFDRRKGRRAGHTGP